MDRKKKLAAVWKNTHKDYRGKIDGVKYVMIYRNGTMSVPLDSLTDAEINAKLPRELREAV